MIIYSLQKVILFGCVTVGAGLVAYANCTKDCAKFDTILGDAAPQGGPAATYCQKFGKAGDSYYQDIFAPNPVGGDVERLIEVGVKFYPPTACGSICAAAQKPQRAVMDPYQNEDPLMEGQGTVGRECNTDTNQ